MPSVCSQALECEKSAAVQQLANLALDSLEAELIEDRKQAAEDAFVEHSKSESNHLVLKAQLALVEVERQETLKRTRTEQAAKDSEMQQAARAAEDEMQQVAQLRDQSIVSAPTRHLVCLFVCLFVCLLLLLRMTIGGL